MVWVQGTKDRVKVKKMNKPTTTRVQTCRFAGTLTAAHDANRGGQSGTRSKGGVCREAICG
jgi:hypothetical protein